ncbi:MAG: FAD-dependent oxidoreductase [Candidatus Moranbacteria bacterium]|nr:FAD-dependent oxidoreductase [Candidatus Moranbacteria bacterium]MDD3964730.1 FAD-dependent oxidoreductase [Candidatus Moranbacteria bacterium]
MQGSTITLKEIRDVADGTRLFVFDKPEGYVFKAGQYVAMEVPKMDEIETDKRGLVRSLSLSSAPFESELYFAMRHGESSFKQTCWKLEPGNTVVITKAVGFFVLPEADTRPIVFLAGGIGVTPVRSILKQAEYEKSERNFIFLYSNRFTKDAAFDEEMKQIQLPHYRYVTVLSRSEDPCAPENDERGYICEETIKKYIQDIPNCLYYIVGSPQFSEAIEKTLIDLGIPKEQCHMDPFTGLRVNAVVAENK